MKKRRNLLVLYILSIFITVTSSCGKKDKDEEITPAGLNPNAAISATAGDNVFNAESVTKSNKKGFVITANQGKSSVTIGTDWPPAPGTYTLTTRNPFGGSNFYGAYVSPDGLEYRTKDDSGTLTVNSVRVENDDVKEFSGTFTFKAYTASGEEIEVNDGTINYQE